MVPPTSLPSPSEPSCLEVLAQTCCDPGIRRLARRHAGDLAEDALQETYYSVARACEHQAIRDIRAYFIRSLINRSRRMRQELTQAPFPIDDPDQATRNGAGPHPWNPAATASAEETAIANLCAAARRASFRANWTGLRNAIPGSSPDPGRYQDIVLELAGQIAAGTGEGPMNHAEINQCLVRGYPEWFNEPCCARGTLYQRRRRARESIHTVLLKICGPDDLSP
jgi:hypothetical protein